MLLDAVGGVGHVGVGSLDEVPDAAQLPLHVLKIILNGLQPLSLLSGHAVHLLVHDLHQGADVALGEDVGANLADDQLLKAAGVDAGSLAGVALGEVRLPVGVVRRVFAAIRDAEKGDPAEVAGLTPREREILISFARGMSYARIAEERGIKPVTVRNAVYGIQEKLDVGSMQELVLWAVRNGLLDGYACGG